MAQYRIVEIQIENCEPYFTIEIKAWWTLWIWIGFAYHDIHRHGTLEGAKRYLDFYKDRKIKVTITRTIHKI